MMSPKVAALLSGAALLAVSADAHSYMIDPYPTWPVSWATNQFAGTIAGQTYLPCPDGMSYQTDPLLNTEAYWTAFNASNYTSLKDLADQTMEMQTLSPFGTATKECGFSLANGTARDLPQEVEWMQFTTGHDGPCEIYCDDVLAFQDDNCAVNYPDDPAKLPYDITKCEGASMLTSYWIALHGLPWQVYINCAPLTGNVNSSDSSAATTSSSTSTSTTITTAPTTSTTTTTAPTTTTAAPTTTTATPSTTTATSTTTTTTSTSASADEEEYDEDSESASVGGDADEDATTATTAPVATTATPSTSSASTGADADTASSSATTTATSTTTSTSSTGDKCNARARRRN